MYLIHLNQEKKKLAQNQEPWCRLKRLHRKKRSNHNLKPNSHNPLNRKRNIKQSPSNHNLKPNNHNRYNNKASILNQNLKQLKNKKPKHPVHLLFKLSLNRKNQPLPNQKRKNRYITMSLFNRVLTKKCSPNTGNFWMTTNITLNAK